MVRRSDWVAMVPILFGLALCSDVALAQSMTKSQVPVCKSRNLGAKVEPGAVAASAGRQAMTLAVQNRSSAACKVEGVPEIAFADKVRTPMPVHVCSNCPAVLVSGDARRDGCLAAASVGLSRGAV